jgi:hypothetical protein
MIFRPYGMPSVPPSWQARVLLPLVYAGIGYLAVTNPAFGWVWPLILCFLGYWILKRQLSAFSCHHIVQALGGSAFVMSMIDVCRAYILPFFQATDFTKTMPWGTLSYWMMLLGMALVLAVVVTGGVCALLGRRFYIPWVSDVLGLD